MTKIAVLGGGSTAYACAADLTLRGHTVRMFSHVAEELQPIRDRGGILATGIISGFAQVDAAPSDIDGLLDWSEIVLLNVSAGGFETYASLIAYNTQTEKQVISFGKGCASLIIARVAREVSVCPRLLLAEGNSALYLCRRTEEAGVWIGHITREVVTAAFPSQQTASTITLLHELFPNHKFVPAAHVVETILLDYNALLHPGPMICNAAIVELGHEDFGLFSETTITPAVINVVEALDRERLALCRAFDLDAVPLAHEFYRQGLTSQVLPLFECFHIELLSQLRGPFSLVERHLSEDVPFGLAAWCALGQLLAIPTPVAHACCVVASVLNQEDYLSNGATLKRLGLDPSWGKGELMRYLSDGVPHFS